jgi:hypothetical protein
VVTQDHPAQDSPAREDRLRRIFTRELDRMQDQHALTYPNPSGRGIASAIIDAWRWLDQTGTTWDNLAGLVTEARQQAVSTHHASVVAGDEDFFAYARADGLSGVQVWMTDIETGR